MTSMECCGGRIRALSSASKCLLRVLSYFLRRLDQTARFVVRADVSCRLEAGMTGTEVLDSTRAAIMTTFIISALLLIVATIVGSNSQFGIEFSVQPFCSVCVTEPCSLGGCEAISFLVFLARFLARAAAAISSMVLTTAGIGLPKRLT